MNRSARIACLVLLVGPAMNVLAAPKADLWSEWDRSDEQTAAAIDHSAWQTFLDEYLEIRNDAGPNLVRYAAVTESDHQALDSYIAGLEALDPRDYPRSEQMAYWINLYNAATVRVVLEHPDKKTILRMGKTVFSIGPWDDALLTIAGEEVTLNDIEHRILRPIWKDHRVHFAVNCASIGCPDLAASAYTSANTESLLDAGERNYLNSPRGVSFDDKGRLNASKIFEWYQIDFAANTEELIRYLKDHADPGVVEQLGAYQGKIKYRYNWDLNGA